MEEIPYIIMPTLESHKTVDDIVKSIEKELRVKRRRLTYQEKDEYIGKLQSQREYLLKEYHETEGVTFESMFFIAIHTPVSSNWLDTFNKIQRINSLEHILEII